MELGEKVTKRVKFAQNNHHGNKPFIPLAQSKGHSKKQDINKLILGVWIRLSEAGEYNLLEQRLQEFGLKQEQKMYDYFRKEGPYLLRCSTLHWSAPASLRFICEHIPKDLLKETLRMNNYSNIEGFLRAHTGLEKKRLIDETRLEERREKLRLLLKVDPEGLEEYMKSEHFQTQFSTGVKASFQAAVEECKVGKLSI